MPTIKFGAVPTQSGISWPDLLDVWQELDRDSDKLDLGGVTVNVDHTPGHTRGSVVFRVAEGKDGKDIVFTGDTLFERSVGRTDLFGGSGRDLLTSIIDKLLVLDDTTVVLPGRSHCGMASDPASLSASRV